MSISFIFICASKLREAMNQSVMAITEKGL
jgi:hypothetical protein